MRKEFLSLLKWNNSRIVRVLGPEIEYRFIISKVASAIIDDHLDFMASILLQKVYKTRFTDGRVGYAYQNDSRAYAKMGSVVPYDRFQDFRVHKCPIEKGCVFLHANDF